MIGRAGSGPAGVPKFLAQTAAVAALPPITGTLAVTETGDTLSAAGTVVTPGTPTFNLVAHAQAAYPSTSTPGVNTTGASLLLVQVSFYLANGYPTTLTDTYGNAWNFLGAIQADGIPAACVATYYVINAPTVGPGHSISWTGGNSVCAQFSAWHSSTGGFEEEEYFSAGGQAPISGRPTATATNRLVITGASCSNNANLTGTGTGWTTLDNLACVPSTTFSTANAYYTGAGATADAIWANDAGNAFTAYNIFSFAPSPSLAGNLTLAYTPGGDRANFDGRLGVTFTATTGQTYDHIGVRKATGNSGFHSVALFDAGGTQLRQANVDLTGGTVGAIYYAPITSITLTSGAVYHLTADVFNGGQFCSDQGPTTLVAGVTNIAAAWYNPGSGWNVDNANYQYVGVDLALATVAPSGITGTLTATQANQTIAATGTVLAGVSGTLSVNQAANTLTATGNVPVVGALSTTQAANTLVSLGSVTIRGTLTATQANQNIVAAAGPTVSATLTANQAPQTIAAIGTITIRGTLGVTQANQTLAATAGITVRGTLTATQTQTLAAAGSVLSGVGGALTLSQAAQTLSATGTVSNYGAEEAVQASSVSIPLFFAGPYRVGNEVYFVVSGQITKAQFYRQATTNVTSRSLFLYDAGGTLVATSNATVAESGAGWIQVAFPSPIPVAAGSNYVISYDASDIFAYADVAPPVTNSAHATWVIGRYANIGEYPGGLVPNTNYAADVIWQPLTVGAALGTLSVTEAADILTAAGGSQIGGSLSTNQAAQTLSAQMRALVGGILSTPQAANTITATGGATVAGTLTVTQQPHTLIASGGVTVRGTVSINQAAQTIAATGSALPVLTATLTLAQAPQTLVAAGTILSGITASLARTQANQTIAATGTVVVRGALGVAQTAQTLAATAAVGVNAGLGVTQAGNTLNAHASVRIDGVLSVIQAGHILNAVGTLTVRGALVATQANQTINAFAYLPATGTLTITQASQTLRATGTVKDRVVPSFPVYGGITDGRHIITQKQQRLIASSSSSRRTLNSVGR